MCIVVLLKLFNMLYAQLGPTMERIKYSILFYTDLMYTYFFANINCIVNGLVIHKQA